MPRRKSASPVCNVLSVMCCLLRLISKNITFAFLFCFTCTKVIRSMGEEVWFYCYNQQTTQQFSHWKRAWSPHPKKEKSLFKLWDHVGEKCGCCPPSSLLVWFGLCACCILTMRKLLPECPWNSKAMNDHPTRNSKISYSSGRNTGLLTYICNVYIWTEATNKSLLCTASSYILRHSCVCVCVCVCARAGGRACVHTISLDASEFRPGCHNVVLIRWCALCITNCCCSCHGRHNQVVVLLRYFLSLTKEFL